MTARGNGATRPIPRLGGPTAVPVPGGLGAGDPLVRALAVCVRQAHARRRTGRALD
jgi:hypothetical protein